MQFNIRMLTALHVFMMCSAFRYLAHLSAFLFPSVSLTPSCYLCIESATGCDRSLFSNVRSPREVMTCERVRQGWLTSGWSWLIIPDVLRRTSLLSDAELVTHCKIRRRLTEKTEVPFTKAIWTLLGTTGIWASVGHCPFLCRVLQYTISTTDLKQLVRLSISHRCL